MQGVLGFISMEIQRVCSRKVDQEAVIETASPQRCSMLNSGHSHPDVLPPSEAQDAVDERG